MEYSVVRTADNFVLIFREAPEAEWQTLVTVPCFHNDASDAAVVLEFMRWIQSPNKILKGPQEVVFHAGCH